MGTVRKVSFESLPLEERIKIATRGLSISEFANGNYSPISTERAKEVERIARKAMSDFNLKTKLQTA